MHEARCAGRVQSSRHGSNRASGCSLLSRTILPGGPLSARSRAEGLVAGARADLSLLIHHLVSVAPAMLEDASRRGATVPAVDGTSSASGRARLAPDIGSRRSAVAQSVAPSTRSAVANSRCLAVGRLRWGVYLFSQYQGG